MPKLLSFLSFLAKFLPVRVIAGRDVATVTTAYLYKYQLLKLGKWFGIHLHRFVRSDEDYELHNHPWKWSLGVILNGGYMEERLVPYNKQAKTLDEVVQGTTRFRDFKPGRLNWIWANTFHRVTLYNTYKDGYEPSERECWTLFISGPVTQSWGFRAFKQRSVCHACGFGHITVTYKFVPWREFIAAKGLRPAEGEYWKPGRPGHTPASR